MGSGYHNERKGIALKTRLSVISEEKRKTEGFKVFQQKNIHGTGEREQHHQYRRIGKRLLKNFQKLDRLNGIENWLLLQKTRVWFPAPKSSSVYLPVTPLPGNLMI